MGSETLKTACLGLSSQARTFLRLAGESEFFDLIAVADSDTDLTQKTAQQYNCIAFDDYRQLVVRNQLDVLIVDSPLCECAEYVRLAIAKKCSILKLVPTASSFDEADGLIRLAAKNGVKYVTACSQRFTPSLIAMKDYLAEAGPEKFYFINAFYNINQNHADTRNDLKSFDGGVLLNECFGIIDAIVLNFSLPQQLYALVANRAPDKKQRQYLPEEVAAITMQFPGGLVGNLVAAKAVDAPQWSLAIQGRETNIVVTPDKFRAYDNNNHLIQDRCWAGLDEKIELLNNFAQSILYPDVHKLRYESSADLATMGFIDSAYLSAKTAMPETPGRIFEISKNQVIGI